MSTIALVIMILNSLRKVAGAWLIALLVLLFQDDKFQLVLWVKMVVIFAIIVIYPSINAFLKYYFTTFHIDGDKLIFTTGIAEKQTTSVPLSKIHTLRAKTGIFYRLLNVHGVTFDTLANEGAEIELILDDSDWKMLLDCVSNNDYDARSPEALDVPPPIRQRVYWKISNANLLRGALCQNHFKGFFVLTAICIPILDKIYQFDDNLIYRFIDHIEVHAGDYLPSGWQWLCLCVAIYLFVLMLWMAKVALRYCNMIIKIDGDKLTIESGLFTRITTGINRGKVSVLELKRNPLERLLGCSTIIIRQARFVSESGDGGNICIYGSRLGEALLAWWLGENADENHFDVLASKSGAGIFYRKFIPNLAVIAVAVTAIHFWGDWLIPIVVASSIYIVVAAVVAFIAWRHSRIELTDSYVRICRGNIASISEYINYRNIESIAVKSTPATRFTERMSLRISTNAGNCGIASISANSTFEIRSYLLEKTESTSR